MANAARRMLKLKVLTVALAALLASSSRSGGEAEVACRSKQNLQYLLFVTSDGAKRLAVPKTSILKTHRVDQRPEQFVLKGDSWIEINHNILIREPWADYLMGLRITLYPDKRIALLGNDRRNHGLLLNFWTFMTEADMRRRTRGQRDRVIVPLKPFITPEIDLKIRWQCARCKLSYPTLYYLRANWIEMNRALMACSGWAGCGYSAFVGRGIGLLAITYRVDPETGRYRRKPIPTDLYVGVAHALDSFMAEAAACARY